MTYIDRGNVWYQEAVDAHLQGKLSLWIRSQIPSIRSQDRYRWSDVHTVRREKVRQNPPWIIVVGLLGFSSAGKSSLVRSLTEDPPTDMDMVVLPEFGGKSKEEVKRIRDSYNHLYPALEQLKIDEFSKAYESFRSLARIEASPDHPMYLVVERDPNDVLAYSLFNNMWARFNSRFTESYKRSWDSIFLRALREVKKVDQAFLFSVPKRTTASRRKKDGLDPQGTYVNDKNRVFYEKAYYAWLIFSAHLWGKYGMGVRTITGNQPPEKVREKFLNHCRLLTQ